MLKEFLDTMTFVNSMHEPLVYQIYISKYKSAGTSPELQF